MCMWRVSSHPHLHLSQSKGAKRTLREIIPRLPVCKLVPREQEMVPDPPPSPEYSGSSSRFQFHFWGHFPGWVGDSLQLSAVCELRLMYALRPLASFSDKFLKKSEL
ncbi:hypothetical protein BaRGS_00006497 [Batillaria attramentaria]|uniref:Uncharacterized protein n=1 Tax=Batillaria attramentaria TaxID=370345 RepID=A0ABD0LRM8_9CAEN